MGLNASKVSNNNSGNNKKFAPQPPIEAGAYPARLVQVLDMGLQPQRAFKGEAKPPAHTIRVTYELVDCFMLDEQGKDIEDKPRWISEEFPLKNLKADLATSTKRMKSLDPNNVLNGDWEAAIGFPLMVTIGVEKKGDKVYENILSTAAMRPRDAEKCPELQNPSKVFDLTNPNMEVFNSLPQWIRDKITGNLNYAGSKLQAILGEQGSDNVPPKENEGAVPEQKEPVPSPDAGEDAQEDNDTPW